MLDKCFKICYNIYSEREVMRMKLSFNEVKAITDTLPIGLYTNRRIATELGEDETSWYNPHKDIILISYNQICMGLDQWKGKAETLIRSNYYHEVSHAILTPKELQVNDIINIFEDERIETLLNKFFFGVDFKSSVYAINGYTPNNLPPIQNSEQAFYYLVRFRCCSDQNLLNEVDRIIQDYKNLHRNSVDEVWDYRYDILALYDKLCQTIQQMPNINDIANQNMINANGQNQCQGQGMTLQDLINAIENGEGLNQNQPNSTNATSKSATQGSAITNSGEGGGCDIDTIVQNALNCDFDYGFHQQLQIMFSQFSKKNSKGACLNGYSGIFNPRAVTRNDYRYFERSTTARGNNQFGTFHLNLFIDVSGSFSNNEEITNKMIKTLELLERQNHNFSFDVIATNVETKLLDRANRFIHCDNGTCLTKQIETIYRKQQYPNTYNYNIVLFDGDAYYSHRWVESYHPELAYRHKGQGFGVFGSNNTTIISDKENYSYIQQFAPNTRTIYTKHYADELIKNVLLVISKALN